MNFIYEAKEIFKKQYKQNIVDVFKIGDDSVKIVGTHNSAIYCDINGNIVETVL